MLVCGGFSLGSTALGGSIVQPCPGCTPNMIITIPQGIGTFKQIEINSQFKKEMI